ncbi:VWA domain-containing protein [Limnohabitans sp. Rim8]|uniref:VWA domain-containing protein n=1 Tax=Limnohabitans sp. Rim8 TaxID=1100718 RepID=UPI0026396488|nr:VWA domain-containing protein [Limnohabitans sp. Rim8]
MEGSLAGFVRALRLAGVQASTAETIDAAHAMALVGFADRASLKASLGVVLAKSAEEKSIHDRIFDLYFSLPVSINNEAQPQAPSGERTGDPVIDALLDLTDGRKGRDALDAAIRQAAARIGVDEIRFSSQATFFVRQILAELGIAPLEARLLGLLSETSVEAQAQAQVLGAARDLLQHQARALVEQRFELFGKPATENFMTEVAVRRPIGRMGPPDIERMKVAVARMAKRLSAKHSQRRRIRLQGQLDFRRTLRANAGHDGVPIHLSFKHKRRDKPRLVVVCDVSGSVAAHVRFLLLFLYALHGTVTDLRSFGFSHRLQDVAAPLETLPFDDAMALILREVGGGATDYGQAWVDLRNQHWDCIDRRTTVLVLGDGRSNQTNPRLDIFAELTERAKRVVWLCNEPPVRWGSGDSCMLQYRPLCTHVTHCASASDLERAIDEALQAYA